MAVATTRRICVTLLRKTLAMSTFMWAKTVIISMVYPKVVSTSLFRIEFEHTVSSVVGRPKHIEINFCFLFVLPIYRLFLNVDIDKIIREK